MIAASRESLGLNPETAEYAPAGKVVTIADSRSLVSGGLPTSGAMRAASVVESSPSMDSAYVFNQTVWVGQKYCSEIGTAFSHNRSQVRAKSDSLSSVSYRQSVS